MAPPVWEARVVAREGVAEKIEVMTRMSEYVALFAPGAMTVQARNECCIRQFKMLFIP